MPQGHQIGIKRLDTASAEADKMEIVGSVIGISGIGISADTIDDTEYGISEDNYRKYTTGMKDVSEISLTARYRKGDADRTKQADGIEKSFHDEVKETIQLFFPAPISAKWTMDCVVSGFELPTEKDGKIDRVLKIKPSGKPLIEPIV